RPPRFRPELHRIVRGASPVILVIHGGGTVRPRNVAPQPRMIHRTLRRGRTRDSGACPSGAARVILPTRIAENKNGTPPASSGRGPSPAEVLPEGQKPGTKLNCQCQPRSRSKALT